MSISAAGLFNAIFLVVSTSLLVVYPWLAVRAYRAGGKGALLGRVLIALALIVVFALLAAMDRFGNALSGTYGYGAIAPGVVAIFLVHLGFPTLFASAAAVLWGRDEVPVGAANLIATGAAVLGWLISFFAILLLRPILD